ncbi:MAG: Tat pathway signal protein, partial [Anaerolineae bacterium]|nr:Tat pathway signal protein [Anaerolineae bacterium]
PKDGALLMVAPSGIPKNAPAPNSGKLLLEFLYSIENSEIQVKLRGLSLRPEVKQLPGQKSLAEIKTIRPTFEEIVNGIPEVKEDF